MQYCRVPYRQVPGYGITPCGGSRTAAHPALVALPVGAPVTILLVDEGDQKPGSGIVVSNNTGRKEIHIPPNTGWLTGPTRLGVEGTWGVLRNP